MYLEVIFFKFLVDKHACFIYFIIIAAIQNNKKYCDIYFDGALRVLQNLICCDQGSIAHVF